MRLGVMAGDVDSGLRHDPFARPNLALAPASAAQAGEVAAKEWKPQLRAVIVAGKSSIVNVEGTIVSPGRADRRLSTDRRRGTQGSVHEGRRARRTDDRQRKSGRQMMRHAVRQYLATILAALLWAMAPAFAQVQDRRLRQAGRAGVDELSRCLAARGVRPAVAPRAHQHPARQGCHRHGFRQPLQRGRQEGDPHHRRSCRLCGRGAQRRLPDPRPQGKRPRHGERQHADPLVQGAVFESKAGGRDPHQAPVALRQDHAAARTQSVGGGRSAGFPRAHAAPAGRDRHRAEADHDRGQDPRNRARQFGSLRHRLEQDFLRQRRQPRRHDRPRAAQHLGPVLQPGEQESRGVPVRAVEQGPRAHLVNTRSCWRWRTRKHRP